MAEIAWKNPRPEGSRPDRSAPPPIIRAAEIISSTLVSRSKTFTATSEHPDPRNVADGRPGFAETDDRVGSEDAKQASWRGMSAIHV